jgi:hypothetical protein
VSLIEDHPRQVTCQTCDYTHVYKPEPQEGHPVATASGATGSSKAKPKAAAKPAAAPSAQAAKKPSPAKPAKPQEPKPPKETKEAKEAREAKRAATEEVELNKELWSELANRLGSHNAINYTLSGDYTIDQVLIHSKFGLGYVTKVHLPNKIEVQFEGSIRLLVMHVGQGN